MKEVFKKAKMYPETWFWCFMVFSLAGWLYEVFVFAFEYHQGFINRGFLFGPFCIMYGFGAIIMLELYQKSRRRSIPRRLFDLLCDLSYQALRRSVFSGFLRAVLPSSFGSISPAFSRDILVRDGPMSS